MNRHDATPGILASAQDGIEYLALDGKGRSMWYSPIETDLAYVLSLRHKCTELIDLAVTRCRQLRMKSCRNSYSCGASNKGTCSMPRQRCCSDRQNVAFSFDDLPEDDVRIVV